MTKYSPNSIRMTMRRFIELRLIIQNTAATMLKSIQDITLYGIAFNSFCVEFSFHPEVCVCACVGDSLFSSAIYN